MAAYQCYVLCCMRWKVSLILSLALTDSDPLITKKWRFNFNFRTLLRTISVCKPKSTAFYVLAIGIRNFFLPKMFLTRFVTCPPLTQTIRSDNNVGLASGLIEMATLINAVLTWRHLLTDIMPQWRSANSLNYLRLEGHVIVSADCNHIHKWLLHIDLHATRQSPVTVVQGT